MSKAAARVLVRIALLGLAVVAAGPARAEPWTPEEAVEAARAAAREDRHQESIEAFRSAMELDPEHRAEWLPELADQLTWSGEPGEAVPLYREALAGATTPEAEQRARHGLALALSWDDQLAESLAEYDALLARDPSDREARLGRARVLSGWIARAPPSPSTRHCCATPPRISRRSAAPGACRAGAAGIAMPPGAWTSSSAPTRTTGRRR